MSKVSSTVDTLTAEVDRLTADVDRLQEWVTELRQERDCLRQVYAAALANTQRLIEAPGRRRFRWPWQRES